MHVSSAECSHSWGQVIVNIYPTSTYSRREHQGAIYFSFFNRENPLQRAGLSRSDSPDAPTARCPLYRVVCLLYTGSVQLKTNLVLLSLFEQDVRERAVLYTLTGGRSSQAAERSLSHFE